MNRSILFLTLNPYIALLIVTVVGAGATLAILRTIEFVNEYSAYAVL